MAKKQIKQLTKEQLETRGQMIANYTKNGKNKYATRQVEKMMENPETCAILNALAASIHGG